MKTIQSSVFVVLLVSITAFGASAQREPGEVKIKTSAVCKMCKATIERQLAFTKGVSVSTLDVPSKVVTVVYNPKKTDVAKIKRAINESGYDADGLPADAKAYNRLEPCCKKDQPTHEN
ncbi:MAG: heavy-metal-associated domain-containing protein [Ferruginibacter sp.]|nr:heavy-metal-associated domain-containing protein [Cytophagales bacterium]